MKKKKSLNITLAIFIGLMLGILFGLFMPGRYEFALPVIQTISSVPPPTPKPEKTPQIKPARPAKIAPLMPSEGGIRPRE